MIVINELVSWLSGCLDALEAAAVAASRSDEKSWHVEYGSAVHTDLNTTVVYDEGSPSEEQAAHIALHDPRAVLARVEAERATIRRFEQLCKERNRTYTDNEAYPQNEPWVGTSQHIMEYAVGQMRRTLEDLAHGHRFDHPGFREEWAPEAAPTSSARG